MNRGGSRWRTAGRLLATVMLLVSLVGVFLHHSGSPAAVVVVGASFAYLMWIACLVALVSAGWARSPVLVLCAVSLVVVGGVQYAPLVVRDPSPPGGVPVTVAVQNLEFGLADPAAVADFVRTTGAEVLLTVEMTPDAVTALDAAGLAEYFPYRRLLPRPGAEGVGIWSRHRLGEATEHPGFAFGVLSAPMDGPAGPTTLVVAHPLAPVGPPGTTARSVDEAERLRGVLGALPGPGAVIVGGDFNATWDHRRFRALREIGYVDSVDGGGDGVLPTWPSNRKLPPLIGIDHVLALDAVRVGGSRTEQIPGTDHRALAAEVVLRGTGVR